MSAIRGGEQIAPGVLTGALIVYLSFNAGGFFPNTTGTVVIALAVILMLRVLLVQSPFEGISRPLLVAAGALTLFAAWTLLSLLWSDSPIRSIVELDRVLLYLLVLVLFGSSVRTPDRLMWIVRGIAMGTVVVCTIALITRVGPDLWPIAPNLANNRLSYPLTYWNALGILASIGIVLCLHLTCSDETHPAERVLAAAALPVLGPTLLFTFSRGAIAAAVVGVVAYVLIARPRALVSGLLASVPATAVAVAVAYHADLLATLEPTTASAVSQGHRVAAAVALCVAAAGALRTLLLPADNLLGATVVPQRARRPLLATVVVALLIGALAVDVPGTLSRQYDRFAQGQGTVRSAGDLRKRLTDPGNNGRIDHWEVAARSFEDAPLWGRGAGTYRLQWDRERPQSYTGVPVTDAHSLYVETLGELGVVGLALLLASLSIVLVGFTARLGGTHRALYGALLAASIAWLVHAGVDWDWEMPAVTVWLFAAGGAALAAPPALADPRGPRFPVRAATALACVGIAVLPALVTTSQSRLDEAKAAFNRGDCEPAVESARSARSALSVRPEPYEILGYCFARSGREERSVPAMHQAIDRDPGNWEYRYGLAIVRGAAGQDPRPAVAAARRMNPFDPLVKQAARRFRTADARTWRREARSLLRRLVP